MGIAGLLIIIGIIILFVFIAAIRTQLDISKKKNDQEIPDKK